MYKYLLFDLDGTLTDSQEGIINCIYHALNGLGIEVPEMSVLKRFLGPPLSVSFRETIGLDDETADKAVKLYRERYSTVGLFENRPFEGIEELLCRLQKAGFTLAVATSKPEPFSVRILERFGLSKYFGVVTGSGLDGSLDTKAEVIEETLRRLGCTDKSRAVMVGDRKNDILGAHAAGLPCIGVGWGYAEEGELEAAGQDAFAGDMDALAELLCTG
ncbi:MAG: HAD hydrolase-like protein [Ruminococcus sp.]|nr:HAD hydrolase-like protein [Ruminococcus sp.]